MEDLQIENSHPNFSEYGAFEREKELNVKKLEKVEHAFYVGDENKSSLIDSMLCDSKSTIITSGFSRSVCKDDEIVMFVNAGGEVPIESDLGLKILCDTNFEGGDVIRTNENIIDAGDFPAMYQSARVGNFSYSFQNLSAGDYFVDLHFAEIINSNGPKGMRVFDVLIQDEKVLSDFDIYAIVGANRPLVVVNSRVSVRNDGMLGLQLEGVNGTPLISGICIRKAPDMPDLQNTQDCLKCDNCLAEIKITASQKKHMRTKAIDKYKKEIELLSVENKNKTNECHEAWMLLTAANQQLEKLRIDLDNKIFKARSLEQSLSEQTENLRSITGQYDCDKQHWETAIRDLQDKIKTMKEEHARLSYEAHACADSIPELSQMVVGVRALVAQCEDLKMKYSEEQAKRKELYNQIQEAKGNIRVFCRCRPLNKEEISAGCATVVDFEAAKDGDLGVLTGGSTRKNFKFDRVYTPKDNQVDVFADASPLVTSVLDGYNVCIFAYGQTGTGKTFTMEGTEQNRGVNYRTLEQLFEIARERSETVTYNISVSVLEVYNEQIRDLLAISPSSKKLEVKQSAEGSHVPGLVEAKVDNIKQVWNVLRAGSNARAVGSNNVNEHSSRSHCMLCVMVKAKNLMSGECTKSKLWLVDLAGSERLAKTDVQGERLKEAQNINRSLSALGDVIYALATRSNHIPYRNSKLTHLLQDSLGGDSKTLMFLQISPSERDLSETLSSLNFATRVRGVELGPARKQMDTSELQKTKAMLDKARQDSRSKEELLRKLEENLQGLESKAKSKDQVYKNQQEKIKELEGQLELKAALHSQSEKQVSQLSDKLKGREESCSSLQQKVKELETKLRERQHSESATLQQKVKDLETKLREQQKSESTTFQHKVKELENKLKEQKQESESDSLILQEKVRELERKLANQQESDLEILLLRQKIKELENKLREQETQLQHSTQTCGKTTDVTKATPREGKTMTRENEMTDAMEPYILKSSNSNTRENEMTDAMEPYILKSSNSNTSKRPWSQGSTLPRGSDASLHETRKKRLSRNGDSENNAAPPVSSFGGEKRIRKSDPPKVASRSTKSTSVGAQATSTQRRIQQGAGLRDNREARKKIWSR